MQALFVARVFNRRQAIVLARGARRASCEGMRVPGCLGCPSSCGRATLATPRGAGCQSSCMKIRIDSSTLERVNSNAKISLENL